MSSDIKGLSPPPSKVSRTISRYFFQSGNFMLHRLENSGSVVDVEVAKENICVQNIITSISRRWER